MARGKWAVPAQRRRKRLLKQAKGFRAGRRRQIRKVKETVIRAMAYRTRDRKAKKRTFRSLWVIRLNAAARARGLTYGEFMAACRRAKVALNRQQLSELALNDPATFDQIVAHVTAARA